MPQARDEIRTYFDKYLSKIDPIQKRDPEHSLLKVLIGKKVSHIFELDVESAKLSKSMFKHSPDFCYETELEQTRERTRTSLGQYNGEIARVVGEGETWRTCLRYSEAITGNNILLAYHKMCSDHLDPAIHSAGLIMSSEHPHLELAMLTIGTAVNKLMGFCSNVFEEFGVELYAKSVNKKIYSITKRSWQNCLKFSQGKKGEALRQELTQYKASL